MDPENRWGTFLDVKFAPLERFDLQPLIDANSRPWYNQTLCRVNDSVRWLDVRGHQAPEYRSIASLNGGVA